MEALNIDVVGAIRAYLKAQPNVNGWINREGVQSVSHVYSVPLLDREVMSDYFRCFGIQTTNVETSNMTGLYAEYGPETFFIYRPSTTMVLKDIAAEEFNQSIDAELSSQLSRWGHENDIERLKNPNFETFKALLVTHMFAVGHQNGMEVEQVQKIKSANSFRTIVDYYKRINDKAPFNHVSHLASFAIIYNIELRVISELFKRSGEISIHDVATNTGHLPLLLNALNKDERFGITFRNIECSDIDVDVARASIESICEICELPPENIQLKYVDLLSAASSGLDADVLVANDVLEHFDERTSMRVLENLWSVTNKLLVVHVPFEDTPREDYDHVTCFNKETLRRWASRLPGCVDVTDKHRYIMDDFPIGAGYDQFLFLVKEAPTRSAE